MADTSYRGSESRSGVPLAGACCTVGVEDYHHRRCPVEAANRDLALRARLDPDEAAERVYNFPQTLTIEVQMMARTCGKTDVHNLEPDDLAAHTMEA